MAEGWSAVAAQYGLLERQLLLLQSVSHPHDLRRWTKILWVVLAWKFRLGPTIQGIYANRERKVYFLTGLKPANFQGLLVHEYTHAWQQVACVRQEIALSEGFASLLQYEWQVSRGESKILTTENR